MPSSLTGILSIHTLLKLLSVLSLTAFLSFLPYLYPTHHPSSFQPAYRYYCNLSAYPLLPNFPHHNTQPSTLLTTTTTHILTTPNLSTTYTHISTISPPTTYNTDCSCFISYVLHSSGLSAWFEDIPKEREDNAVNPPMPRAKEYAKFILGLQNQERWEKVSNMWDIKAGDLIAWQIPDHSSRNVSTGHIAIVIPPPHQLSGEISIPINETAMWVSIADASNIRHQWDSRCDGNGCYRGVGHGYILLRSDERGRIVAFQFREGSGVRYYDIGVGRVKDWVEPLVVVGGG